ncbi:MAG: 30S ribosomal protein S6--L-glutamate ligase [Planctomycetes bacterium]|nr:30S ribosomal protein S6--L-glutamate ligase [Planctomycetota bacterium]MCA8937981.1 30S ribosomal protein S6--L-glutamate ligase [Planctomycetota bacterium]
MKIAILSQGPRLYSTRRLRTAAEARGHKVRILDPLKFSIDVEKRNPHVYYKEKRVESFDAVIPRIGASVTFFGTAVVRQYEQMGVFCLNTSSAITTSRDKLRAFQILSRHNIGIPKTSFVRQRSSVMPAIERVGGAPVIIKLLEGTQGIGVILADSNKIAEAIVETLQSTRQNVLIQNFVEESRGTDVRAFVVGGRVVAAMRRSAKGGEFRSNVHRGGEAKPVTLDPEYERTAVMAAQILGLRVAGVDMLEGKNGPQLMEVNSSPGLEGIEAATGVDVAGEIIQHIEEQVQFPDMDIRQRLTLEKGYGVAEIPIGPDSELVGKTIKESGLRDRDILVLSIIRESQTIPNPKTSREILAGDRILCYGKLLSMKTLFPLHPWPKKRSRRTSKLPTQR